MSTIIGAEAANLAGLQIDLLTKLQSGNITADQLKWWLYQSKADRDKIMLAELASRS